MATQYRCKNKARQTAVRNTLDAGGQPLLTGIDYLEVVSADQRTLAIHLIHPLPAALTLTPDNILIQGGVRVTGIRAQSLVAAADVLTIVVDQAGDFSTYTLRLVTSPTRPTPPAGIDPPLSEVEFSFKADCPSDFDCAPEIVCPPQRPPEPVIDYLAKDYASFRRLMLDRLAVIMPAWQERNPADVGIMLVEALAYAADHLSYYQDAVATEAYLGTARQRISVRRHARLLDYPMHDGANARTWVHLQVTGNDILLSRGARLLTLIDRPRGGLSLSEVELNKETTGGALVFETLADIRLFQGHNEIRFYTWGDEECCLPRGTTRATLLNVGDVLQNLAVGDVLVFEEVRGPNTGRAGDADPTHRHAVRLTRVTPTTDPLFPETPGGAPGSQRLRVVDIEWAVEDALPFPLCLDEVRDVTTGGPRQPVSLARGNVVLADHGRTVRRETLPPLADPVDYRPVLALGPLTQQGRARDRRGRVVRDLGTGEPLPFDPQASAVATLRWQMRDVLPALRLEESGPGNDWQPQRDLLNSGRFARDVVAEVEGDRARLRFGDGVLGAPPVAGLQATYRVGNGRDGNVGAEAIAHVVKTDAPEDATIDIAAIRNVRNPLPAVGGEDPEPLDQVRLYAPQAFRTQERAVTADDYAAIAQRHPEVQKAAATLRWTGSWYTVFVTVDRLGGQPIDADFETDLRDFIESFRLAGHDLEIDAPLFVPLDVALDVCVKPGYFRSDVKEALLRLLSSVDLPDGRRGFFHPDNFTFGQPVYLSQIIAAVMQVPGVAWLETRRFQRWGRAAAGEVGLGFVNLGRLEIARLDNDPNRPENGRLELIMQGGL